MFFPIPSASRPRIAPRDFARARRAVYVRGFIEGWNGSIPSQPWSYVAPDDFSKGYSRGRRARLDSAGVSSTCPVIA